VQVRLIGWILSALAACLVVAGAIVGWAAPHLAPPLFPALHRYLGTYLRDDIERTTQGDQQRRMLANAATLLDELHELAQKVVATWDAKSRANLASAYDTYRSRLLAPVSVSTPPHTTSAT